MRTLRFVFAVVVVAAIGLAGAAHAQKSSKVTVINKSDWTLVEFYMAPSDSDDWGPDQLKDNIIEPGENFTLSGIPCNTWDLRLVDEEEDECIVEAVDLCKDNATWTITNKTLAACVEG
jgi:hypothetical protein